MNMPFKMPRMKGFRFLREIIAYAVWAYYRFSLSTADVEDLLAERGVRISRKAIRRWVIALAAIFPVASGETGLVAFDEAALRQTSVNARFVRLSPVRAMSSEWRML